MGAIVKTSARVGRKSILPPTASPAACTNASVKQSSAEFIEATRFQKVSENLVALFASSELNIIQVVVYNSCVSITSCAGVDTSDATRQAREIRYEASRDFVNLRTV